MWGSGSGGMSFNARNRTVVVIISIKVPPTYITKKEHGHPKLKNQLFTMNKGVLKVLNANN